MTTAEGEDAGAVSGPRAAATAKAMKGRRSWRVLWRTVDRFRHSNRGRPALCIPAIVLCRRVGVHKHLLARAQLGRAAQPHQLTSEVGLETVSGPHVCGNGDGVLLDAARAHGDLHMQRRARGASVGHNYDRQLTGERGLELLAGTDAWRHGDCECLHHRAVAGRHERVGTNGMGDGARFQRGERKGLPPLIAAFQDFTSTVVNV